MLLCSILVICAAYDDTWHCIAYIRQGQTLIACCDGIGSTELLRSKESNDDLTPSGDLIIGGDTWGLLMISESTTRTVVNGNHILYPRGMDRALAVLNILK